MTERLVDSSLDEAERKLPATEARDGHIAAMEAEVTRRYGTWLESKAG